MVTARRTIVTQAAAAALAVLLFAVVCGAQNGRAERRSGVGPPATAVKAVFGVSRGSDRDVVIPRDGGNQRQEGTLMHDHMSLSNAYLQISLESRFVAGVDLQGVGSNLVSIVTVNNNRISGRLAGSGILFAQQDGVLAEMAYGDLSKIVLHLHEGEEKALAQRQFVRLSNGDILSGRILADAFVVATDYASVPLPVSDTALVEFYGENGRRLARVRVRNGDVLEGEWESGDLAVELDLGPTITLPWKDLAAVSCLEGYRPELAEGAREAKGRRRIIRLTRRNLIGFVPQATPEGVRVTQIVRGSAAEKAGLEQGDLIVSVNGKRVTDRRPVDNARNEVFLGEQRRAVFVVRRGNYRIVFLLIRSGR